MRSAGEVLDITVAADVEGCLTTTGRLSRLAEAAGRAGGLLHHQAQVGEAELGGCSGATYRASSDELAGQCDRLSRDVGRLAAGLADYARDTTEVRRLMDDARAVASPLLTTTETAVFSPVAPAGPDDDRGAQAWLAWREARAWWRAARELETAAEQRWLEVLAGPAKGFEDDLVVVGPPLPGNLP